MRVFIHVHHFSRYLHKKIWVFPQVLPITCFLVYSTWIMQVLIHVNNSSKYSHGKDTNFFLRFPPSRVSTFIPCELHKNLFTCITCLNIHMEKIWVFPPVLPITYCLVYSMWIMQVFITWKIFFHQFSLSRVSTSIPCGLCKYLFTHITRLNIYVEKIWLFSPIFPPNVFFRLFHVNYTRIFHAYY